MFNLGAGEIAVIMIVALLLLGPDKLPELARGIGKFVREFRRQTDDVRGLVEREFYKMDQEISADEQAKRIEPPAPAEPVASPTVGPDGELAPPTYPSIFPPPEGVVAARPASAAPLTSEPPSPAAVAPEPPPAASADAAESPATEAIAAARPEGDSAPHG